jgi:hypothetical protein
MRSLTSLGFILAYSNREMTENSAIRLATRRSTGRWPDQPSAMRQCRQSDPSRYWERETCRKVMPAPIRRPTANGPTVPATHGRMRNRRPQTRASPWPGRRFRRAALPHRVQKAGLGTVMSQAAIALPTRPAAKMIPTREVARMEHHLVKRGELLKQCNRCGRVPPVA